MFREYALAGSNCVFHTYQHPILHQDHLDFRAIWGHIALGFGSPIVVGLRIGWPQTAGKMRATASKKESEMLVKSAFVAFTLLAAAGSAYGQELVQNGGFETGGFSNWSTFGETTYIGVDGEFPHTGTYAAFFGPETSGGIQQTLTASVGDVVNVSFWYATDFGDQPNYLTAALGSVQLCNLTNLSNLDYVQFTATVTVQNANPVLMFTFSDPADFIELDDVSVTLVSHGGSKCGSADFNCDGDIATDADIEAFFACIAGNCPPPPCTSTADFNGDGDFATDADIEAFFRVLAGGTC
jgi:hypothetical protein